MLHDTAGALLHIKTLGNLSIQFSSEPCLRPCNTPHNCGGLQSFKVTTNKIRTLKRLAKW